jgi:hypothetical protein
MTRMIKLTMIENEVASEGEDDTVTVHATTAVTYVMVDTVRSIHARKAQDSNMPRPTGTRVAFTNGSQFSVTESPDDVAALIAPTLN